MKILVVGMQNLRSSADVDKSSFLDVLIVDEATQVNSNDSRKTLTLSMSFEIPTAHAGMTIPRR